MTRKLASIRRISKLEPIEGADRIELATVDGWKVIVAKDVGHKIDDLVVYCEVDSFLPIKDEFEFLRKSSYRKLADGSEGFRLRTMRMRGTTSQGLILPMSVLDEEFTERYRKFKLKQENQSKNIDFFDSPGIWEIGLDVTEFLGIVKYDPPLPAELNGKAKGYIPEFIQKTDEERIQNLVKYYPQIVQHEFYEAEKLDGSSTTYYLHNNVFGVCSRNLDLEESEGNTFWRVARELDIENKMRNYGINNFAIQGELIGEGIQKNPYGLKGQTVRFFSALNTDSVSKYNFHRFEEIIRDLELETVPVINRYMKLPDSIEDLINGADGKSVLNHKTRREGLVYRSLDGKWSFKAISNEFLVKEKD